MSAAITSWEQMLSIPDGSKEERFHRVAWSVAVSLMRRGPEGVRIAEVARRAEVSRAWIYKYVASDRASLIRYALAVFGQAFGAPVAEDAPQTVSQWRAQLEAGTRAGLNAVAVAPWCLLVYVRYRHAQGPLGEQLRQLEADHLQQFVMRMPQNLRGSDALGFARTFFALRLGLMHQWLDPTYRESPGLDMVVAEVMRVADARIGALG